MPRHYTLGMTETIVYLSILAAGILLMIYRPLSRRAGILPYWEIGAGVLAIIFFIIFVYSSYITPQRIEEDLAKAPCGSNTPQGICYSLDRKVCETMWEKAHLECRQEMADVLASRPTGLIGPALNRCKAKKMDKVVHFNRANTESAYCKAYFEYIAKP
ncbi:hypothetical protein D3C87_1547700 [compost metagenome]